jgi:hypothetical protein
MFYTDTDTRRVLVREHMTSLHATRVL